MFKVITPRGNRKKSKLTRKKQNITTQPYKRKYEPSNIASALNNSPYQRWHRVYEWNRYINDPCEKQLDTY